MSGLRGLVLSCSFAYLPKELRLILQEDVEPGMTLQSGGSLACSGCQTGGQYEIASRMSR